MTYDGATRRRAYSESLHIAWTPRIHGTPGTPLTLQGGMLLPCTPEKSLLEPTFSLSGEVAAHLRDLREGMHTGGTHRVGIAQGRVWK